jgi:hypothetical protein
MVGWAFSEIRKDEDRTIIFLISRLAPIRLASQNLEEINTQEHFRTPDPAYYYQTCGDACYVWDSKRRFEDVGGRCGCCSGFRFGSQGYDRIRRIMRGDGFGLGPGGGSARSRQAAISQASAPAS